MEKEIKNNGNKPYVRKTLNLDYSSKNKKLKKFFLNFYFTIDELFNDFTHVFLRQIYQLAEIECTKKNDLSM